MNIQETLALIEALKANGVTKFKSQEHEIELNPNQASPPRASGTPDLESKLEAEKKATEQIKGLINTINLSPEELANKLFPDGAL